MVTAMAGQQCRCDIQGTMSTARLSRLVFSSVVVCRSKRKTWVRERCRSHGVAVRVLSAQRFPLFRQPTALVCAAGREGEGEGEGEGPKISQARDLTGAPNTVSRFQDLLPCTDVKGVSDLRCLMVKI
jgi:hypothetical protein